MTHMPHMPHMLKAAALLTAACLRPAWSDIAIKLVDAQNKPIAGVSCAQSGGAPSVSDQDGSLVIRFTSSSVLPRPRGAEGYPLSQIPLAPGEKADLAVFDFRGRKVLERRIAAGERHEFSPGGRGIYFVSIAARGFSARGRIADLGRGIRFEGMAAAVPGAKSLRKAAAAAPDGPLASITCSKAGSDTRVYQLLDGTSITLDFSRLHYAPLYDASTKLEPDNIIETPTAVITRFSDRARDRHAREDQFKAYDHYLTFYWEFRTATIQITDEVAKGGKKIRIDQWTLWPLDPSAREFRAFYRGIGTVAEYHHNVSMQVDPKDPLHYFTEFSHNAKEGRAIQAGDRMEIEVSQFLDKTGLTGRDNYYGTTYLYIVGKGGMVPWESKGVFGDASTEREDSHPLPEEAWLGGRTTIHQQYTDEPDDVFMQMATNMAPQNGQVFVHGRRVHHTNFADGSHDEPGNPVWDALSGKAGPNFVNNSCTSCHHKNARALPPVAGSILSQYVMKVGDADGHSHPQLGSVLQPKGSEGSVTLSGWTENGGLRKPAFSFPGGAAPAKHSARITPQLVGMGLLEAVPEAALLAMADPEDRNGDGISGRLQIVTDYVTGEPRVGRFGWKAGKPSVAHQVAGALNTDIGVLTSIYPKPDCGSAQADCGGSGSEIGDADFRNLVDYIALLGVRARRNAKDPEAVQGEALFKGAGCAACHAPVLVTGPYHPKAELRNQTVRPFTDLLLHDMGPGLADNLGEGEATGSEWRTAPLWNIGLTAGASGGEAYLHDGRARTLQEAILWHGGEAEKAANAFKAMTPAQSGALIKFLKSL